MILQVTNKQVQTSWSKNNQVKQWKRERKSLTIIETTTVQRKKRRQTDSKDSKDVFEHVIRLESIPRWEQRSSARSSYVVCVGQVVAVMVSVSLRAAQNKSSRENNAPQTVILDCHTTKWTPLQCLPWPVTVWRDALRTPTEHTTRTKLSNGMSPGSNGPSASKLMARASSKEVNLTHCQSADVPRLLFWGSSQT